MKNCHAVYLQDVARFFIFNSSFLINVLHTFVETAADNF